VDSFVGFSFEGVSSCPLASFLGRGVTTVFRLFGCRFRENRTSLEGVAKTKKGEEEERCAVPSAPGKKYTRGLAEAQMSLMSLMPLTLRRGGKRGRKRSESRKRKKNGKTDSQMPDEGSYRLFLSL